ncbi:MAG: metallophosphoesterase [Eubacteriales bacterium]|nr:metallophosphoesterase [Eubacteriales bacterium]
MTGFFIIIMAAAVLIGIYSYFLLRRIMKFYGLDLSRMIFKIVNILLALFVVWICSNMRHTIAMALLHVLVLSMVLDIAALACRKIFAKKKETGLTNLCRKLYGSGLVPVMITAVLFTYGFVNMNHPTKTEYTVETDKKVRDYKIVLITDTHYATIQNTDLLKEKIGEINAQEPDIVILGGDIVEEGTTKEKMQEVFQRLGGLESKYGIYYVYGNHDRQPYTNSPAYTREELENAIAENGITILEDSYMEINDDLVLAGRADAAWGNRSGRASAEALLDGIDREKYIIVADHQPIEAEENDAQGADLLLSGHTHAGQIWPVGCFTELTGGLNYGEYRQGNCKVIVSSGFTGWGYPVRTQEHCEYVMINITH